MAEEQFQPPGAGQNAPEPPKKGGLFAKKSKPDSEAGMNDLAAQVNNTSRRMRLLEESYSNVRKKIQLIEQNMISNQKDALDNVKTTNEEMDEIRKEIEDLKEKFRIMIDEIKETAKIQDVKVLENYINLWNPMQFVTRKEVEKLIKKIVEEKEHA